MVTMAEILIASSKLKEDAPIHTAHSPQERVPTSVDVGNNFLSHVAHSDNITQAQVLGILFKNNWENPHTAEEIKAAYIGASTNQRAEINSLVDGR